jgi:hypothetical protein
MKIDDSIVRILSILSAILGSVWLYLKLQFYIANSICNTAVHRKKRSTPLIFKTEKHTLEFPSPFCPTDTNLTSHASDRDLTVL